MTLPAITLGPASAGDLDGILLLQAANQIAQGGSLSAEFSRQRIAAMMDAMPLLVARRGERVVAYLMTSSPAMNADVPIIQAMLYAYGGPDDAYVYGPICVDQHERGQGLAQALFTELRQLLPRREGILFVREDNAASLRAHEKMGLRRVASFDFGGVNHTVFSTRR